MSTRRTHRTVAFAGPRALAVLSCALALLAAQPWRARAEDLSRPAAVRSEGVPEQRNLALRQQGATSPTIRVVAAVAARREAARVEAHATLHATWAILQRLLAGELLGANRSLPGVIDSLDVALAAPVSLELCIVTSDGGQPRESTALTPPPPCERQFAIAHCLLAPPR